MDANGLQINSLNENIKNLSDKFKEIYGGNINLDPDSPDMQMLRIFAQGSTDLLELVSQVYNSFDPDTAMGSVLDRRVAFNGIQRRIGTFSTTKIKITNTSAVTLMGINQSMTDAFTVADATGNRWNLIDSITLASPSSLQLFFQAEVSGSITSSLNSITVVVTPAVEISAVINDTPIISLGVEEESDSLLRERRRRSTSLVSQGYKEGMSAALADIEGVEFSKVYENTTDTTDSDGIPAHSIWVIVTESTNKEAIADTIYRHRNAGCGMTGTTLYDYVEPDGRIFPVKWDSVVFQKLYVTAKLSSLDGINPPDTLAIRDQLPIIYRPEVNTVANVNDFLRAILSIDSNSLILEAGFFSNPASSIVLPTIAPATKKSQFLVDVSTLILYPLSINFPGSPKPWVTDEMDIPGTGTHPAGLLVYDVIFTEINGEFQPTFYSTITFELVGGKPPLTTSWTVEYIEDTSHTVPSTALSINPYSNDTHKFDLVDNTSGLEDQTYSDDVTYRINVTDANSISIFFYFRVASVNFS